MLSSVLRSERAALVNVEIMRAFVRLRQTLQHDPQAGTSPVSGGGFTPISQHHLQIEKAGQSNEACERDVCASALELGESRLGDTKLGGHLLLRESLGFAPLAEERAGLRFGREALFWPRTCFSSHRCRISVFRISVGYSFFE